MTTKINLSLIITYRKREKHLKAQIAWWKTLPAKNFTSICEVLLVEVDEAPSTWIYSEIEDTNIQYLYINKSGAFHKTKALNLGLSVAKGKFIAPFDVDLIPLENSLEKHLQIAELSPQLLITGYRVMCDSETVAIGQIPDVIQNTTVAPEDKPTALWKHLICKERFGVVPFFERQRLLEIGGWDEAFIGWGGEDQDMIERYLADGRYFMRSPELVYLHLAHPPNTQWTEASLIEQNRKHYYTKRQ